MNFNRCNVCNKKPNDNMVRLHKSKYWCERHMPKEAQ